MTRIFISYRRDDAGYVASIVRDHLESEFGAGSVFMDIDSIPLGVDFRQHLADAVAGCDVLIALIGETWAGTLPGGTQRRLDDPRDFVRIEIETALKRGIPVVPVLIDKAQPPADSTLPPGLRELAFRNAAELRAGRDLQAHLQTLTRGLHAHLGGGSGRKGTAPSPLARAERSTPAADAPTPPPVVAAPAPLPAPGPGLPTTGLAIAAGMAAVVAIGGWWVLSRPDTTATAKDSPKAAPTTTVARAPVSTASSPDDIVAAHPPGLGQAPVTAPAPAPVDRDRRGGTVKPSALEDFTIAIYYPTGDTPAGVTARALKAELATQGIRSRVELRLATAKFLRDVVPADTLEVRYEEGPEADAAQAVAAALAGGPGRRAPRLVPVSTVTPKFLSVFVPPGG